jgi:capsule polysaccharide export protein KpsE/RkpR
MRVSTGSRARGLDLEETEASRPDYGKSTAEPLRPARARLIGNLSLLWGERRTVARLVFCGLALGTLLAFLLPKQYQSTVQLMPPDTSSSSAAMMAALSAKAGGGLGAVAGDLLGGNSTGYLFVGILRSRTLVGRLVERFGLMKIYGSAIEEDARVELSNNTGISEEHKSGIITISVVDRDPARARAIAQAYVEELTRLVSELSTSAAHRERIFLEERLVVAKRELDQASGDFSQFASQNTAINIPEQGKAMVEAAAVLQGQLIGAESELKGLSEIYTAGNVRVRSAQARVSELRRQLDRLDGPSAPATQGSGARSAYPTLRELPLLGVTYADLLRRTKIAEALYETLTQQYELAKVQEAKETPSVKVLDAASFPERKVFPPRLLIMASGGLLGLSAAVLWVIAGTGWQRMDAGDPGKLLASEVFQTAQRAMPWAPPNGSPVQALAHRWWMRLARRGKASQARE